MNLEQINRLQEKPEPFAPGEPLFWDDPHISTQMLSAHLNPDNDLASRQPWSYLLALVGLTKFMTLGIAVSLMGLTGW